MQFPVSLAYGAVGAIDTCKPLLSLAHGAVGGVVGGEKVVVKKESSASLMRKQQARQQASLASVYERNLALERAVSVKGQENTEQAAMVGQLADEVAALSSIHEPIKGRAGMYSCAAMFPNTLKLAYCNLCWHIKLKAVSLCSLHITSDFNCLTVQPQMQFALLQANKRSNWMPQCDSHMPCMCCVKFPSSNSLI